MLQLVLPPATLSTFSMPVIWLWITQANKHADFAEFEAGACH
jgi:hypothetical protein